MSCRIVPVAGRLAVLVVVACCASPVGAQETLTQYLSGKGPQDAVPWDFSVTGARRAGVWTTIPVPSNWELSTGGARLRSREGSRDSPALWGCDNVSRRPGTHFFAPLRAGGSATLPATLPTGHAEWRPAMRFLPARPRQVRVSRIQSLRRWRA